MPPDIASPSSPEQFWAWFTANEARFRGIRRLDNEPLLDEILSHLHAYSERLFFMIGGDPDRPTELIVTAEGDKRAFGAVRALVDAAPKLAGWKFIAFKPAGGFAFVCTWEGARIDVKRAWFLPLLSTTTPAQFGVRLGCDEYVETLHDEFVAAAYVVLDTALGELVAASEIHHVDVGLTPSEPESQGYMRLSELPAFIAWQNAKAARGAASH